MTETSTEKGAPKQNSTMFIEDIIENQREKIQHHICKCGLAKLSKSFNIETWTI